MMVIGIFSFCFKRTHLLIILLRLEYISLGVFVVITEAFIVDRIYFPLLFLVFIVCEGAVGLSILVIIRRRHGIVRIVRIQ